jgi:hypothetical protein
LGCRSSGTRSEARQREQSDQGDQGQPAQAAGCGCAAQAAAAYEFGIFRGIVVEVCIQVRIVRTGAEDGRAAVAAQVGVIVVVRIIVRVIVGIDDMFATGVVSGIVGYLETSSARPYGTLGADLAGPVDYAVSGLLVTDAAATERIQNHVVGTAALLAVEDEVAGTLALTGLLVPPHRFVGTSSADAVLLVKALVRIAYALLAIVTPDPVGIRALTDASGPGGTLRALQAGAVLGVIAGGLIADA